LSAWPRVVGRVCPMPLRRSDGRLVRGEDGKTVFPGWHGLKPYADNTGFACVRCSATFRWAPGGRHVEETRP
jgi:hypothetical protein